MKAVIVLSGGQDSTTCLFMAKKHGHEIHAVTFDYNQRHRREIDSALKIGKMAGVKSHELIQLGPILQGTSPLVSDKPLEQYESHHVLPGGLEKTFVPMRNQLFLTIAANRAYVLGAPFIITGVSSEDYGGYPDCRPEFIRALTHACVLGAFTGKDGSPQGFQITTPLMHLTKAQSVDIAIELEGCYEALAFSHTSYDGAFPPTGHDHATLLRAKGFEEANVPDPLILRAWYLKLMDLPSTKNYEKTLVSIFMERLRAVL